jgi:RHS repeat-associated protein
MYATTSTPLPWNSPSVNCTSADPGPGNLLDLQYNFSLGVADNGNVTGITNKRDTTRSQVFTYDSLNRILAGETTSTYATSPSHCWSETYVYDNQTAGGAWGNLTNINAASSAYSGCTQESLNVTANAQNRIGTTGYIYDTAGNLTNVPNPGGLTAQYNAENQLTSANGTGYTYDGDGKRVQKSSGKLYWYGMGSDPLDETDAAGNTNNNSFSEYIFFNGKRIARCDSTNAVNYYFADHLGTARVVANASGTILDDSDFYPFGGERVVASSSGNNYKFTGKERDSESNLDDFEARYYSSSMGRFVSADWSTTPEPVPYADLTDPQTLNLYGYVRNNPLSHADADGHCCDLSDVVDFSMGVLRGASASISFGAAGSPQATDTDASRFGQIVGSGAVGALGEITSDAGKGAMAVGLVAEAPSAGTSTLVVVGGAGATALGTAAEVGAAANLAKLTGAPMQTGFSQKTRDDARANAGGKCEYCGQNTEPGQKSQKGVTPPGSEGQTDHYNPASKGGSNDPSNAVHSCRDCNQQKSNTPPQGTKWENKKPEQQ